MVRARTDDQKQILTICLVLFVLLSIVLGATTWLGYSGQTELEESRKKAKADQKVAEDSKNRQEAQLIALRLITGTADEKDQKQMQGLGRIYQPAIDAEAARVGNAIVWDATQHLPNQNLLTQLEEMKKKQDAALAKVKATDARDETNRKDYEAKIKEKDQALADLDKKLKDTSLAIDQRLKGVEDEYAKAFKALKDALPDNEKNLKDLETLKAEKVKLLADLKKAREDMDIKIKKLEDKIPQIDLLGYDQPKGKVVTVDNGQTIVYLNLGSADFVKPGLSFSIFGEGEYKPTAERKASVEVVNVDKNNPHMSMARVTEIKSPARRPIVKGDLLYNPGWAPGLRDHVAIAGLIDLNGDGRDGTAEFVKALEEKHGIIVDAWLDLKDLSLKGALKAIGPKTSYLIVGDEPDVDKALIGNQIDPRLDKKMTMRTVIHDLKEDAKAKGVYIVDARRYMALAGMKVPKPASEFSSYIIRPDKPAEKKDDKAMEKKDEKAMEKKDEKKEDK
jgi:hypothetical protein